MSVISGDGVGLSADNKISNIAIQTAADNRAIYLNSNEVDLGEITIENVVASGVVQLLTRGNNKKLTVKINNLDIIAADARKFSERPMKYGVNVYQGALTIYNFNPAQDSEIKVIAENVSVGREKAPVIGSGIFISGFGDESGFVEIEKLTTGDVYSNGMIPTGQPNLITGGIFIVYGAHAKEVVSNGIVVTYGTNDMVLDVWGSAESWITNEEIISYGPSGIGFVNFGDVKYFRANKAVKTYGLGARGFNQYDGTIEDAYFEEIYTKGDGSIGMQFSKPVGKITIGKEVRTEGASGQTLVKGVIKELKADAISVLEGGEIGKLEVKDLITTGDGVVSYHVNGGVVKEFNLSGEIVAKGSDAKAVLIENKGQTDTESIKKYL